MTTIRKTNKSKKKSAGFNLMPILIIMAVFALAFTFYIGYRASISDKKIFSVSLIALFAGLIYESYRVSNSWKKVLAIFIGSYFISLFNFLPGKREQIYIFENHIESWPYAFIVFFAILFVSFNKEKVTAKLTEGVTLLLSISVIYWCFDYGFTNYDNWFAITLLSIVFVFSAFSILNAFTTIQLTRTNRLALSIWSTIIMFAFAVDNIFRVFSNQDIETTIYLSQGLYIGLQYFLLGVSAVYIMQNYLLLAAFLPSRNGNYKNDLKENKKDHIDRFSEKQVFIWDSFFCILYAVIIYGLNYKYQLLPRHTMIWLVFLTFPMSLQLVQILNTRKIKYL